jgi:hypothetical protein
MKFTLLATALTLIFSSVHVYAGDMQKKNRRRLSKSTRKVTKTLTLRVINQTYQQPLSGFFVMVHNDAATPLYVRGNRDMPASDALAQLAENGNPGHLVAMYEGAEGVKSAMMHFNGNTGGPTLPGASTTIEVEVDEAYPLVTIASMAVNTNDCFVSINGADLYSSGGVPRILDLPGLDAGSEPNNELCACIPGPNCVDENGDTLNVDEENNPVCGGDGEGFVHVHRGIQQIGDVDMIGGDADWRNPMVRVIID